MMPAMATPPGEPQPLERAETDLDPEDALLEVDEDGFLVDEGHGWHLPTGLDAWVIWAAIVAVAAAAFQTLATLAVGSLDGWGPNGFNMPLPLPAGYLPWILLGGLLVLAIRRNGDAAAGRARWVRDAACLAAGTGSCLAIAQLAGNIGIIVRYPETALGEPPLVTAANVVTGIGGFADVVADALAAALGVVLFRWSRARSEGPTELAAVSKQPVGGGPALASLLLGVAVAAAALVAFRAGVADHPNDLLPPAPSSSPTPSYSLLPYTLPAGQPGGILVVPSPTCISEPSGPRICYTELVPPTVSPSPSPRA